MTAPSANFRPDTAAFAPVQPADVVVRVVGQSCETAVAGRRAAKALARWSGKFQLTEPEFQILWYLRIAAESCIDQTTLAKRLAFSAAQVSASVEKLRAGGWILQREASGDRRRRLWQLSASGDELILRMLLEAGEFLLAAPSSELLPNAVRTLPEVAA